MPETKRMVAISIGIADAKNLPYLSGAHNGALAFERWACSMGYESYSILDTSDIPVTAGLLKSKIYEIIGFEKASNTINKPLIHRFILYFAGHGMIREIDQGLWLLSDWYQELEAVSVEVLRRRLGKFGIKQIGIFADACQKLPSDIDSADLTPDGVLGRGPGNGIPGPDVDKFFATHDGEATLMVPGATPEQDQCLFSDVLMSGLTGKNREAFSRFQPDAVTSNSLGEFLKRKVPDEAHRHGREIHPKISANFPEDDNVYYHHKDAESEEGEIISVLIEHTKSLEVLIQKESPLSGTFTLVWMLGRKLFRVLYPRRRTRTRENESILVQSPKPPALEPPAPKPLTKKLQEQSRPPSFESHSGFAIDGRPVRAVWVRQGCFAELDDRSTNWWKVGSKEGYTLRAPTPALVEFDNGTFGGLPCLPDFIGSALYEDEGISAFVLRITHGAQDQSKLAERALGQLASGTLTEEDRMNWAVSLRYQKHSDPVLGMISAYLYEGIGDVDNIRRMAFYFANMGQPIPFDIAMLGDLKLARSVTEDTVGHVPAVQQSKSRTAIEDTVSWTHSETPSTDGIIGGNWPWLRQGWAYVDEYAYLDSLKDVRRHLKRSRFTTFDAAGANFIAETFGLERFGD
jgi:hypothetical protein